MKLSMAGAIFDAVLPPKKHTLEEIVFLHIIGTRSIKYVLGFLNKGENFLNLSATERKIFLLFIAESIS